MAIHRLEARIEFFGTNYLRAPFDEVILEHAFVHLMEEVRCEAGEYVGVREEFPEGIVNSTEAKFLKFIR